jgi:hypothetical protein
VSKPRPEGEYDVRLAEMAGKQTEMMTSMRLHIEADSKAFEASADSIKSLIAEVRAINEDVKVLLSTRSFAFGAWKAAAIIGAVIVSLAGLYIAFENLSRAAVGH